MRPMLKRLLIGLAALVILVVLGLGGMIAFGGPKTPPPLASIQAAVLQRDRSDLPNAQRFATRDGTTLAYRLYPVAANRGPARGAGVLIHGSVGSGADMHEVAEALSAAGIAAYAPDLRGHGASGTRGDIAYIGELEDDLDDLLAELDRQGAPKPRVLIGHSSGGGFALRVAASPLGPRFAGAILLAPYLGADAPTAQSNYGGWVGVGVPRFIALAILNRFGINALGGLPVLAFAVAPEAIPFVTPEYSFRLAVNYAPHRDWRADIAGARIPLIVLAGSKDQLFRPDGFAAAFAGAPKTQVELLPGIDHMGITGDPAALSAIVGATKRLLGL
jgi:alpha-beta hydrolase superfamily lysophospholipase